MILFTLWFYPKRGDWAWGYSNYVKHVLSFGPIEFVW